VSRDEIGVEVSFKDMTDSKPVFFGGLHIKIHVTLGINHDRLALRPEHVRSMGQAAKIKLFEVHMRTPSGNAQAKNPGNQSYPLESKIRAFIRTNSLREETWKLFHIALS
jgi:hypothetical protein